MRLTLFLLCVGILAVVLACTNSQKETTAETAGDTSTISVAAPTVEEQSAIDTSSFDDGDFGDPLDSYFANCDSAQTFQWLQAMQMNIKQYSWDVENKSALRAYGTDSVYVWDNCNYGAHQIVLSRTDNTHSRSDTAYWMNAALQLAQQYQMTRLMDAISQSKLMPIGPGWQLPWYRQHETVKMRASNVYVLNPSQTNDGYIAFCLDQEPKFLYLWMTF
jgi:hypothetical protein